MLHLHLIIILICWLSTPVSSATLEFRVINNDNLWPGRQSGQLYSLQNYTDVRLPAGSLIIYAGLSVSTEQMYIQNQIWSSQDGGLSWDLWVPDPIFPNIPLGTSCVDPTTKQMYLIQYDSPLTHSWTSTNLTHWTQFSPIPHSNDAYDPFENHHNPQCLVDNQGVVYYFTGANATIGLPQPYGDLWISQNQTRDWYLAPSPSFQSRYDQLLGYDSSSHLIYVLGGQDANGVSLSDLWVSADSATTWILRLKTYPWSAQSVKDATFGVSSSGILVVNNRIIVDYLEESELWISLDTGHNWGQCTSKAEYGYRRNAMLGWGSNGTMYIGSGYVNVQEPNYTSDLWISNLSFNDTKSVATACQLQSQGSVSENPGTSKVHQE